MAFQQHIPFLSIFVSLIAAILIPLFGSKKIARALTIVSISVIIILSAILLLYLSNYRVFKLDNSLFVDLLTTFLIAYSTSIDDASLVYPIYIITYGVLRYLSLKNINYISLKNCLNKS